MKDFPPDGTKVRLGNDNDFLDDDAHNAVGIFTRHDPTDLTGWDKYGYVELTPPIITPGYTTSHQWVRPQDIELIIPIARTHQVRPQPQG